MKTAINSKTEFLITHDTGHFKIEIAQDTSMKELGATFSKLAKYFKEAGKKASGIDSLSLDISEI